MTTTDKTEIKTKLIELLSDIAPEIESGDEIDAAENVRDQVDLDSMDFLNFITDVAKAFKVDIPEKDYAQLLSLNDFVAYLSSKTN